MCNPTSNKGGMLCKMYIKIESYSSKKAEKLSKKESEFVRGEDGQRFTTLQKLHLHSENLKKSLCTSDKVKNHHCSPSSSGSQTALHQNQAGRESVHAGSSACSLRHTNTLKLSSPGQRQFKRTEAKWKTVPEAMFYRL